MLRVQSMVHGPWCRGEENKLMFIAAFYHSFIIQLNLLNIELTLRRCIELMNIYINDKGSDFLIHVIGLVYAYLGHFLKTFSSKLSQSGQTGAPHLCQDETQTG